jgi:hypothetical protein
MANNWAPQSPGALGSAWYPIQGGAQPVAEGQDVFWQRFVSTNAKTITGIRPSIEFDPTVTDPLFTLMEVIPEGSERPTVTSVEYPPSADETIGSWVDPLGGTTNLWSQIDNPVAFPINLGSGYIINIGGLSAYRCSVDSGAFPLTARVCRLVVRAMITLDPNRTALIPRKFTFSLYHQPSGAVFQPAAAEFVSNGLAPNPVEVNMGEINPVTMLPWSPLDVRSFDAGDWHVRVTSSASASCGAVVAAMSLQVYYVTTENRAAVGPWQRPSPGSLARTISTDALVSLSAGAWVANWAKPASGAFLLNWRRAIGRLVNPSLNVAGDIKWLHAYQDLGPAGNPAGISYPPVPGMTADQIAHDANGIPVAGFTGSSRRAARFVLRTSVPGDDDDSQPYFVRFDTSVLRAIHSTLSVDQLITAPSTLNYIGVKTVVVPPTSHDSTLSIGVFNAATNAQLGQSYTITADEVRALPQISGTLYRYVEGFLPAAAALTASTQYALRLYSTDGSSADPWIVACPDTDGNGSASFGGTTDRLRLGYLGTSFTGQDVMAQLLVQPSAPTFPRSEVTKQPYSGGGGMCSAEAVDQVTTYWVATTLGGAFARYEVERITTEPGADWQPIGQVTSAESYTHWTDTEPARGRRARYRVRVVSTTTAVSPWAYGDWVQPDAYGAEIIFTSNQDPDLLVAVDWEPSKATAFRDFDGDTEVAIIGKPNVVVFKEAEAKGKRTQIRLIVHAENAPCDDYGDRLPDDQVWDTLLNVARASLPYVCVLDHRGNRTQASIELSNGESVYDASDRLAFYWCDCTITPVGDGAPSVAVR